jgi:hypothetical protein
VIEEALFLSASPFAFPAGCSLVMLELQDQASQISVLDQAGSLGDRKPPHHSLPTLRPFLQLPFDQQWKDLDLTPKRCCSLFKPFLVHVMAKRASSDAATHPRLFVGLAGGRPRRFEPFDRPALWDDPSFCSARGNEQDLDAGLQIKSVGQRSELNTNWSLLFGWPFRNYLVLHSKSESPAKND